VLRVALWSFSGCGGAWFCQGKLLHPLHFDKRAKDVMNLTSTYYDQQQGELASKQQQQQKKNLYTIKYRFLVQQNTISLHKL
jgi:hypothetical protein